ncbi:hypothetical protein RRG08_061329 [Elysia crispata]|uniref:Uncharacterized protein n=1 Tax=Elysia crispata TaxID=231223 RepID=A0AAE1DZ03_9GAST|nr:hypothetical protein RRG08_061329 [Elysia crispata]
MKAEFCTDGPCGPTYDRQLVVVCGCGVHICLVWGSRSQHTSPSLRLREGQLPMLPACYLFLRARLWSGLAWPILSSSSPSSLAACPLDRKMNQEWTLGFAPTLSSARLDGHL